MVAKDSSRSLRGQSRDVVSRASKDEEHHEEHAEGKRKKRRRLHFASDLDDRVVDPPSPTEPLPSVSRRRLPHAPSLPVIITDGVALEDVKPSATLHGFEVKRRDKLLGRPAKDLKLPSKSVLPLSDSTGLHAHLWCIDFEGTDSTRKCRISAIITQYSNCSSCRVEGAITEGHCRHACEGRVGGKRGTSSQHLFPP